ncbi:MAG: hypothetical protein EP344_13740 [Bacteroidetes bacterium]|nr:MAG: hypothetical protein EP344_13740 [Bacteroidota bacterium]
MNEQARKGRRGALRLFIAMILVSLLAMAYYQDAIGAMTVRTLIQQFLRFLLPLLFMYLILQGMRLAIQLFVVLLAIAVAAGIASLWALPGFLPKIPILLLVLIYGAGFRYFTWSADFREYVRFKNRRIYTVDPATPADAGDQPTA